jgi:hypothetical protein
VGFAIPFNRSDKGLKLGQFFRRKMLKNFGHIIINNKKKTASQNNNNDVITRTKSLTPYVSSFYSLIFPNLVIHSHLAHLKA